MRRVRTGSLTDRTPRLGRSKHRERCQPPSFATLHPNAYLRAGSHSKAAGTFPGALSAPNVVGAPVPTVSWLLRSAFISLPSSVSSCSSILRFTYRRVYIKVIRSAA